MDTLLTDAQIRISSMGFTDEQYQFIFADWPEGDEHLEWLLQASRDEIVAWGEAANWGAAE